jgi:hypothetical protein
MSFALARKLEDFERRIAFLEAERARAEGRRLAGLRAQANVRRAQGMALRAEIRAILEAHRSPRRLKAYAVLTMLNRTPLPSLRRVQEIIRELKGAKPSGTSAHVPTQHSQSTVD